MLCPAHGGTPESRDNSQLQARSAGGPAAGKSGPDSAGTLHWIKPGPFNEKSLRAVSPGLSGDGEFFFQLLLAVEAGVVAVESEQLVVTAQLHNFSVVQHGDLVGIAHGGDTV